ncbi:carbohydrate ABC transporter permease [Oceanobacillus kimchii]|uniref:carbohydrate ABC transporter permease n=1 Tax=Oceanobacillus kimchii TaxID=746691 RepID=UPI00098779E6|nr:carbohydrate ABC transporter permease [Oceanobacillus kimchii]
MKSSLMNKLIIYALLLVGVVFTVAPFYWMVIGSTNATDEILSYPPKFLPGDFIAENLKNLMGSVDIWKALLNSSIITITYTIIAGIVSAAAGFAFAKYHFKGKKIIFAMFILSMMIPYQALVIPQFNLFANFGLLNTHIAVILPQLTYPFAIFLIMQNMKSIPDSLLESARIDGAGEIFIFVRIALPTMIPALAAVSIFLFTFQWNNFLWPLVSLITEDMYTLPVALATIANQDTIDYGQLMLGATISVIPIFIIFLFMQRYFVAGILGGAIKE